jgi:RNA polymerase sigma factor (sigma-70 family)
MIEQTIKIFPFQSVNQTTPQLIITDDELVKAVLAGDESAFESIFTRYRRLVVHLVGRFFNQPETVEDISQQSFTKAYFSLKDFRGENDKSFQSWLSRLTVNVCYDELRRSRRKPENLFSDLSDDEFDFVENIAEHKSLNSEESLSNKDLTVKLLQGLEVEDRLAVTLYYAEENSVAEVAEMLGWSESKLKTRLYRTRNYLRNVLSGFDRK